jgi:hypothetical protein
MFKLNAGSLRAHLLAVSNHSQVECQGGRRATPQTRGTGRRA